MHYKFPEDVAGWLTPEEGAALARLAAGRRVLEVGSYQGRSTVLLAQVALHVVAVDHHLGDQHSGPGGTLLALFKSLERYRVANVTPVVGAFAAVAPWLAPASFGLVYVDASHDEASVRHDVRAALALAEPGGTVALHDWGWESVRAGAGAGDELFAGPLAGRAGNLAWFRAPLVRKGAA